MADMPVEVDFIATPDQIAGAVLGGLRATAQSTYVSLCMAYQAATLSATLAATVAVAGKDAAKAVKRDDVPPDLKRRFLTEAYGYVVRNLPVDSPFRAQVEKFRDEAIARVFGDGGSELTDQYQNHSDG